jgi:hypothetical protein
MMSYNSIVEMVTNQALILRVAACAAEQGISNTATNAGTFLEAIEVG